VGLFKKGDELVGRIGTLRAAYRVLPDLDGRSFRPQPEPGLEIVGTHGGMKGELKWKRDTMPSGTGHRQGGALRERPLDRDASFLQCSPAFIDGALLVRRYDANISATRGVEF